MSAEIIMQRNPADIWPDNLPVGTFDIRMHGVQGYPAVTASINFICPNGRYCGVFMGAQFVPRPTPDKCVTWGWDGNVEQPTLTPSINCIAEENGKPTGGCGWHGHIHGGKMITV